jgi:hypothetical protein
LIDSIVKDGVDSSLFWSLVDPSKLASGVKSFMSAIQKQRSIKEAERLSSVNILEENIELPEGLKLSAFPALSKHGVTHSRSFQPKFFTALIEMQKIQAGLSQCFWLLLVV